MPSSTQGFAQLTPAQRSLAGTIGVMTRWSRVNTKAGRTDALAAARDGRRRKLERQADPFGELAPEELAAAVVRLRAAHQARMTLASAQARAARASGRRAA